MKKRRVPVLILILLLLFAIPVSAAEGDQRELPRFVDDADLLTDEEEAALL